ncbi:uroporphyrinogen decarboxylase [bacterium]|nr:uroporphyrinogen decarboxylase [bacterium]
MSASFPPLQNDRFLKALRRQPVDRTPVWMMRQAGRYLPEYRATRAKAGDFMSLCQNPELACEVTMQPLARYPLDAAILFSDILTIPDAMGLGLYFAEGEGPRFERPISSVDDIRRLPTDIMSSLTYVVDAVSLIRRELQGRVPLIGFSGSPWTLATYMIEGGSTRDFAKIKTWVYSEPTALHDLLDRLAVAVTDYLSAQLEAGAQALQIFDTWGGVLSDQAYLDFSLRYMQRIVSGLRERHGNEAPIIVFTKNGFPWLKSIADSGCDCVGLDWTSSLSTARGLIGDRVALQGNMDPAVLRAPESSIEAEVKRLLAAYGHGSGHVFNLGHGITPDIDPAAAGAFIDMVHELSLPYHTLAS